jgi:hypothetical protein
MAKSALRPGGVAVALALLAPACDAGRRPAPKTSQQVSAPAAANDRPHLQYCSEPDEQGSGAQDQCNESNVCTQDGQCSDGRVCSCGCCAEPTRASQSSPVSPSGHEFLTSASADSVRACWPILATDGKAEIEKRGLCTGACRHGAYSFAAWSAIMGARWADLMGFRAGPFFPAQQRCLLAVAQDNEDVQYDHALRKATESGPSGGMTAAIGIRARLTQRFLEAVLAPDEDILIADGGAQQDHFRVRRPFFLFGRAVHIVQDSFSRFHGLRGLPDFRTIEQINSYVCTPNAPIHPHVTPGVADLVFGPDFTNGDIIWKEKCQPERRECLKPEYEAAVRASGDLWVAFLKVDSLPLNERSAAAHREMDAFSAAWMQTAPSMQDAGMPEGCPLPELKDLDRRRASCLNMTGRQAPESIPPFDWHRSYFSGVP